MRAAVSPSPPPRALLLLGVAVARLEEAQSASADEVERVGDHRVEAVFGGLELDDRALCRGQVDGLAAPVALVALRERDALLDDAVEDRPDDVERAVDAGAGVEDEHA